mmetsp:Transcript_25965/g.45222  ORF Transcript_25965/g.45222 Transcript_25965/m.45222 type:complete len:541 (-) Transcript_25965:83-1705(-)
MNLSRSQLVCAAALGGSAGLIAILIVRQKRKDLHAEAELKKLEEERVQREVDAAKQKAERDKRRRLEFDSPKALRRKEEDRRRKDEEKRFEEERRAAEEKRRADEEARIRELEAAKRKAEEDAKNKAFEEEWKRKAEEHAAKHRQKEEEVQRAHLHESDIIREQKAGGQTEGEVKEAASQSAKAEADEIEEEKKWHEEEEALIAKHHKQMLGAKIRIHSTGHTAIVEEIVDHSPLCKVVYADTLEDGSDDVTVWAREDALDSHPEVGYEVTVTTLKRIGHLSQVSDTDFPYQVKFSDGHVDLFRARDVEIHRGRGVKVRISGVTARLHEFDESGTYCFVQFLTGTIAGETAWLDEDHLEAVPVVGCSMSVKSRNQRGELVKYDGNDGRMKRSDSSTSLASVSSSRNDFPYMIRLEDGSSDWYKSTDAQPVFEVGSTVSITSVGLFDEITEPPHERPYQIRFCSGPKADFIDWARRCNFSQQAEEGSPVIHSKSGRIGVVVKKDDSDIPCKVLFNDDNGPAADWFREEDLKVVPKEGSASQ